MRVPSLLNRLKNILFLLMFISGLILIGVSWQVNAGKIETCADGGCWENLCGGGFCQLVSPEPYRTGQACQNGPFTGCCYRSCGICEGTGERCYMSLCDGCLIE